MAEWEKDVEDCSKRTSVYGQRNKAFRVLDDAEAHGVCY